MIETAAALPIAAGVTRRRDAALRALTPALVALGCAALAARAVVAGSTPHPTATLSVMFGLLLIVGMCLPLPAAVPTARSSPVGVSTSVAVAFIGVATFATGRVLVGGHAPLSFGAYAVATSALAAVAEEVWFRRLCFGLLLPAGPGFAIAGSTALFAVVHVATYGWWVLPLDLAAGALLGWQRAVSGSWTAPALTHVMANLLVLL